MIISKSLIKKILPKFIIRFITGFFYGWRGNYNSWEEAEKKCTGYDSKNILEKVKESGYLVKAGSVAFERDSVTFEQIEYSFPLLAGLLWIAAQNKGRLNILDFGGSLGSTYYQNKFFIQSLPEVNWCIVEQANFVNEGKKNFSDERLKFYESIDNCLNDNKIDTILLSSVLQYFQKPYELLEEIKSKKFNYIIIDRTGFINGNDRITVQKVPPSIYKASYPCWFLNKEKFMSNLGQEYDLVLSFNSLDESNLKSEYMGFIYCLKSESIFVNI
jgi:putative methyltransferase (TIGR04325 family)